MSLPARTSPRRLTSHGDDQPGPRHGHCLRVEGNTVNGISAAPAHDDHTAGQHTPQVRAELIPEDMPRFDEAWRKALAEAGEQLDLAPIENMLEQWRMVAWAVNGEPERCRRMSAHAEAIQAVSAAGEPRESIEQRFGLVPASTAEEILARRSST